jgi:hypothetical protein
MVPAYAGVTPNPAKDERVKLPLEEPEEVQPPHADHVEAVGWLLTPPYLIGLVALDVTGARIGEVTAAKVGDPRREPEGVARSRRRLQDATGALGRDARRPVRHRR